MIVLKPFELADLSQLNQWIKDERQLLQFAGDYFTFPLNYQQIRKYLFDGNRFAFQVIHQGNPIGHAEIYKENSRQARLCRMLISDLIRGKGLGKEIVKMLLYKCFSELVTESVHLHVFDWNIAAIKCYEKCGFQITPYQTTIIHLQNEIWKTIHMTITKAQWSQNS